MRVRQSFLKSFMACPLSAALDMQVTEKRELNNALTVFGTIIHYVLDQYHKGIPVEECIDIFKEIWNDPERVTVKPDIWPKYVTFGGLRERGIDIINGYHKKNRWESRRIIASEHRFLVPMGDHELEGTVDFIEVKKDGRGRKTLRISDLKTSAKQPTIAELKLNIQFTVYTYASMQREFWVGNGPDFPGIPNGEALFQEFKNVPRRGVWFHLRDNKELDAGERDDVDFRRLYRLIEQIDKAMSAQAFVPMIGDACTYCAWTSVCEVEIPNRDQLALEMF